MKSAQHGSNILPVEVTNISIHDVWMIINDQEFFLSYQDVPWFQDAPIKKILHVEMPSEHHLYWPELDVDLDIDSIISPDKYPLVSQYPAEPQDKR